MLPRLAKPQAGWILVCALSATICAGCATTRPMAVLPSGYSVVRDQLVVYSDFDLPRHHRLLDELASQRGDVAQRLELPTSDEPIYVYLFDSPEQYRDFVGRHFPDFPERRAVFVETDTRLSVYAHWSDRVAEDLRHEVAHGYLHAVVPHLPLWLDEGLAEYFEPPRHLVGLNQPHVDRLLADREKHRWSPDMARLERMVTGGEMTQRDYAEAWAWVYFLLETTPERRELLRRHLAELRKGSATRALSGVLYEREPRAGEALVAHLESLRG